MAPIGVAVRRVAAFAVLAAVIAACSGCGAHTKEPAKETLDLTRSRGFWRGLDPAAHLELVRFCKAPAGIAAAQGDTSVPAPYFSDRYEAVQRLLPPLLAREITVFFAEPRHHRASIQQACSAVAKRLTATRTVVPRVVFAPPATRVNGPIEVTTERDRLTLRGTLSAHVRRARVLPAPDRGATGVTAGVRVRGLGVTLSLGGIPRGRSYLQLILYGRGTQHSDLIVVRRMAASRGGADVFPPIRFRGSGNRIIPRLQVPATAVLSYRSAGSNLGISDARGRLRLATTAREGRIPIAPGTYHDVLVVADGSWQIVIASRGQHAARSRRARGRPSIARRE